MTHQTAEQSARQRLATIEAPWVTGVAGLAIIGTGLLVSIRRTGSSP